MVFSEARTMLPEFDFPTFIGLNPCDSLMVPAPDIPAEILMSVFAPAFNTPLVPILSFLTLSIFTGVRLPVKVAFPKPAIVPAVTLPSSVREVRGLPLTVRFPSMISLRVRLPFDAFTFMFLPVNTALSRVRPPAPAVITMFPAFPFASSAFIFISSNASG